MKFTVGTVSTSLDLSESINLVKSSVLYADEIELIGMAEYLIYRYLPMMLDESNNIQTMMEGFIPLIKNIDTVDGQKTCEQLIATCRQLNDARKRLQKNKHHSRDEILFEFRLKKQEGEFRDQLEKALAHAIEQLPAANDQQKLYELIGNNIISVYDYNSMDLNSEFMAAGYFANLLNAVQDGQSYPLFDYASTEIIKGTSPLLMDIGKVNGEVLRHAGIASNILMTLPTLQKASFDELLDLKRENSKPLNLFRKAIYGFSEEVTALPWDKDFQYECLKLYNTEVVPYVAELNEILTETSVLKNLGRELLADEEIRKSIGWLAGGLATAIVPSSNMMNALTALRSIAIGISLFNLSKNAAVGFMNVINHAVIAADKAKENKKVATGNAMYYYYLASTELKRL